MDPFFGNRASCAVCGLETKRHTGWFLVAENRWLDRLTILTWHPIVARQPRIQIVCGENHLRTLLTHWLTYANLQFLAMGPSHWRGDSSRQSGYKSSFLSEGKVVGELAIHRESLSRVWTGSPEALECILNALMGGIEIRARATELPWLDHPTPNIPEYALH